MKTASHSSTTGKGRLGAPSSGDARRAVRIALILLGLLTTGPLSAFPPAPHHTLYGMVRNQFGDPLTATRGEVILESPTGAQLRTAIVSSLQPGVNYSLEVPMDAGTAADLYQPTALRPFFQYRLKVVIGSTVYLPIEMMGNFARIGKPGESTRLDLTLGEDTDADGLPDAWERTLIAIYGGTLSSINPNDDTDGDGISNLDEYLAGTYAFDPSDGFRLTLVGVNEGHSQLEFLAIRTRTYTIQASVDLQQWTPVSFRILTNGASGALLSDYLATDVRNLRIEVPPQGGTTNRFFKALVH